MGQEKNWTKEEKEYLEENWGIISVGTLMKRLNRSEYAIINARQRMGLGAFLENGDYITFHQLLIALGVNGGYGYKPISWIENRGFPIHRKRINNNSFRVVYLEEFWIWAEKNQTFLDFSKFEEYALGAEPEWAKAKRKRDFERSQKIKSTPWSDAEDKHLERLLKKYQYNYDDLSKMLGRTAGAIQRRICDLGLKERPLKAENHIKWTEEEFVTLGELIKAGSSYEEMADVIGKSSKAIRGRVYALYLTENLDKVRGYIGSGTWGDNRPERKLKQRNLMNSDEKEQVKDAMTRFAAIVRHQYKQHFDESDYWQKDICQLWKGYCTSGETDCDSCVSFQRIRPQACKQCGGTFYERETATYCKRCRDMRKWQQQKKFAVLMKRGSV